MITTQFYVFIYQVGSVFTLHLVGVLHLFLSHIIVNALSLLVDLWQMIASSFFDFKFSLLLLIVIL
jgi:hypothetical protein